MKISKILAGMSAAALAASMMTMAASAAISNATTNDGKYIYDVFAAVGKDKAATISKVKVTLSFDKIGDDGSVSAGGDFIISSDGNNWKNVEFGNTGSGKPIEFVVDADTKTATIERTIDETCEFKGKGNADMSYAQVAVACYWGDFAVEDIACYDAAGTVVCSLKTDSTSSSAPDSSKAEETSSAAAGDSSKPESSSKADDTSKPADDKDLPVLSGVPYVFGDIEDNGKIRLELFNEYGESKNDKTLADAFSKLAANKDIEVKFKLSGVPKGEYEAKLMFCDNDWKWNTMDAANPNPNKTVKVTGDGEYSVKLTAAEGAAVTNGAKVFCVDIDGLATALKIQNPKGATPALKQKLVMDAGLKVSDVKILVDGVEFDPTGSNNGGDKKDDNKGSSSVADGSSTTSTTSTTSTNSTGTTSSKAANNASNTNPSTGAAALAAVGVALAGAAVVATKKRK